MRDLIAKIEKLDWPDARMPENLDFVIQRLEEACRGNWFYGYTGDDGRAHNSFGDALSHLRNYRALLKAKEAQDG